MKFSLPVITLILLIAAFGCRSKKRTKAPTQVVPVAINIRAEKQHQLQSVNFDIYRFKILQDLRQFQHVDLELVDADENPEVTLDLNIDHFIIWPRDERSYRRVFTRTIAVGTDTKGKPIYQTVSATVDFTYTTIRSNARFITRLTYKGAAQEPFQRTFVPRYTFNETVVGNINGDSRAVDPSVMASGSIGLEPTAEDFLLALSREEMIRRISDELRKRYR
ncbi:MAG TPA: hypothetical protein VGE15_05185 [Sphingobacteriaceae bacterium]